MPSFALEVQRGEMPGAPGARWVDVFKIDREVAFGQPPWAKQGLSVMSPPTKTVRLVIYMAMRYITPIARNAFM